MNKKALLDYALFARKELETQIALSLNRIGIYKDHVSYAHIVGDRTIIEGIAESFDKRIYDLRKRISEVYLKEQKFEILVEEFAYTWFNRIIAIRFMELHDYFSHGFRVLSSRDGSYEPEILKNLPYVVEELNLNVDVIQSLKDQNKTEELYRYVLIKQCNALNPIFPELFDKQDSCLEFLLPNNLLGADSVIRKISIIPEEDFMNDIEVVGWLYQFYNSVKKDEVFASKKTITKDTLPAVTQLFTPDWIVRYMADNSVGRLWLESYPNSSIKDELKYYVEDAEQDEETNKKLEQIRYKNVDPETIKVIEPCCGSGHILVYVFDLLYKMYLEKGYNSKDIPSFILKNNLYGLDVDKRAAQLAQFSLIMKARSIDNRFFSNNRFVFPNVYDFKDSQLLIDCGYESAMANLHFSKKSIELAKYLVETFRNAKVIGSLLKVESKDYSLLLNDIQKCLDGEFPGIFEQEFYHLGIPHLKQLISLTDIVANRYDIMITNPPYIGISSLEDSAKAYAYKNYKNSKSDMFAMFMEVPFVKGNGFRAMINMQGWMFLSSYEEVRKTILFDNHFVNMIHLGAHAFDTIGGEVVNTTAFVFRKTKIDSFNTKFIRLVNLDSSAKKQDAMVSGTFESFVLNQSSFGDFPGHQLAYWVSDSVRKCFKLDNISKYYFSDGRNITGDNNTYLRYHWEVASEDIGRGKKWLNYVKGGGYRKWFGNILVVVDWSPKAREFYHKNSSSRIISEYLWYKTGITWNLIASGNGCFRIMEGDNTFDMGGPSVFPKNDEVDLIYTLAYLNTNVVSLLNSVVNQTINYQVEHILSTPILFDKALAEEVNPLALENIKLVKEDWDLFEVSSDFKKNPLVNSNSKIEDAFVAFKNQCLKRRNTVKENEEKINSLFINKFELENELSPVVEESRISCYIPQEYNEIANLISYLIGLLMGRYSLTKEGVYFAGCGKFNKQLEEYMDDDGILPIYQFIGIESGLTNEICKLIERVYGSTYFKENLEYIAKCLGRKNEEDPIETLNRYLNESFYSYHVKQFEKRPIYWMLSSGKMGAFKCLVYMNRFDKNTLALINSKYFLPRTALYKVERERLQFKLKSSNDPKQIKLIEKQLENIYRCEEELLEYGQILDHLANKYLSINLDEGVKKNYCKFQGTALEINGATIKKDLFVAFGLEKK